MGDDIPAVDQYGNRGTFRKTNSGGGCLTPLFTIGIIIAIIGGIFFGAGQLVSSAQNYFKYHVWTPNQDEAIKSAAVTAVASSPNPWGGTLVLNDSLQDNSMGYKWDEGNDNQGDVCGFKDGAYHVSAAGGNANYCTAKSTNFDNFAYQVTVLNSNVYYPAGISLLFRFHKKGGLGVVNGYSNSTETNFTGYELSIDYWGDCALLAWTGSDYKTLYNCKVQFNSPVNNIPQPNVITIVAKGSTFDLYINYQHITTMSDNTYSTGQIGVEAAANPGGGGDLVFSDAKVWKL